MQAVCSLVFKEYMLVLDSNTFFFFVSSHSPPLWYFLSSVPFLVFTRCSRCILSISCFYLIVLRCHFVTQGRLLFSCQIFPNNLLRFCSDAPGFSQRNCINLSHAGTQGCQSIFCTIVFLWLEINILFTSLNLGLALRDVLPSTSGCR